MTAKAEEFWLKFINVYSCFPHSKEKYKHTPSEFKFKRDLFRSWPFLTNNFFDRYFLSTTAAVISSGRPGQVRRHEITTPTLKLVEGQKKKGVVAFVF